MSGELALVVGADTGMQGHLASLLQRWGYTPVPAHSLEEVTAALTPTRFLFSLVDGEFARAGGLEVLQQLRVRGGDPGPIIMLADPNTSHRSQETPSIGIDAILHTPVECTVLERAIREVLSRPRGPSREAPADEAGRDIPEPAEAPPRSLKEIGRAAARAAEREAIAKALEQTGWNRVRAARLLRISYRALLYKIKEAGLKQRPGASTHPPDPDPGAGRPDLHPPPAA